jgi:manganese/zinc/iron transport system permease protein
VFDLTTVGAFDAVGSILIVALMITPPATAYLLTVRLKMMFVYSMLIGCLNSVLGYYFAVLCDASIAGSMCVLAAINFLLALVFSREHGLLMKYYLQKQQKLEFSGILLTIQLLDHEHTEMENFENSFENLIVHMKWSITFSNKVVAYCLKKEWVVHQQDYFVLTVLGREIAKKSLVAV